MIRSLLRLPLPIAAFLVGSAFFASPAEAADAGAAVFFSDRAG